MWYRFGIRVAPATSCKALFTRNVCVNVNIKFNIVFMMTGMQTQRIDWTHFLRLRHYWHSAKLDANIDFDATREHTLNNTIHQAAGLCAAGRNTVPRPYFHSQPMDIFFHSAWNDQ